MVSDNMIFGSTVKSAGLAAVVLFALAQSPLQAQEASLKAAPAYNAATPNTHNLSLDEIEACLTPLKGKTPAQWRIVWSGDASRTASISWSTAEKAGTNIVYYGRTDHGREISRYKYSQECQLNGTYSTRLGLTKSGWYHHAAISGLKPDSRYFFVLSSDDSLSKRMYFKTAPSRGTGFAVIHGGDSRSRHLNRCRMNMLIAKEVYENPQIIALIHGGDYVMIGKSWNDWKQWLSHNELTTGGDGRVLPIIPVRGNHDYGPLYFEVFNLPDRYTTLLGKDVSIVSLNIDDVKPNKDGNNYDEYLQCLDSELKDLRKRSKWLLASYHLPLYPAVKPIPEQTALIAPIFEKHNIDLGCECDGHNIKRTIPIRNGKPDPTGITYIGEGGMGVTQRTPKKDRWYLRGGLAAQGNHIMLLNFGKKELEITTILQNGKVFDKFTLPIRR